MSRQHSIKVEINRKVFNSIKEYFGITDEYLKERYKLIAKGESKMMKATVSKLRNLSDYLRIPVSVFFLSEPPNFPAGPDDHRKRSQLKLSKNTINAIRNAYWYQQILNDLTTFEFNLNLKFNLDNDDPINAGKIVSEHLKFEELRKKSHNPNELLRKLRYRLDEFNIFTFKENFPSEETRGFSIINSGPPIIVINRHDTDSAKIFTVLHELGHILLNLPGISEPTDVEGSPDSVESWCDQFSASITIPHKYLEGLNLKEHDDIGPVINQLHDKLLVSKHSIALALLHIKGIFLSQYQEFINRPYSIEQQIKKSGEFRIPRAKMITSNKGKKFTMIIMDAYNASDLPENEVRELLNVKDNDKVFEDLLDI